MAEYILRDQAIIAVTGAKLPDVSASGLPIANGKRSVTDCVRRLKEIPAADVRPVVTCAECKHWTRIKKDCILASCDLDALVRCEDFYCANGEKREES